MSKSEELARLRKVLLNDNIRIPNSIVELLKNDINTLLSSYFSIDENGTSVEISIDENGAYHIRICAAADNVKTIKILS